MIDRLSAKTGYTLKLKVEPGATREDLLAFGKKLSTGQYQIGVLWGIEYGWLLRQYPDLRAFAVCSPSGDKAPVRLHLMVRKQKVIPFLKGLKGKILARCKNTSLMDRLGLDRMLREEKLDPKGFFREKTYPRIQDAVAAVKKGEADCFVVNVGTMNALKRNMPALGENLEAVAKCDVEFPLAVMIASKKNIDRRWPGLWDRLQKQLVNIHKTTDGRQCVTFWQVRCFVKPDAKFQRQVRECARAIPIDALLTAPK